MLAQMFFVFSKNTFFIVMLTNHKHKTLMKGLFALLTLFLLIQQNFAQQKLMDSLAKSIQQMPEDTNKVLKTNELSSITMATDPQKAYDIAVEALLLAEKLDYKNGQALSYKTLGNTQYMQGALQEAITYYEKGLLLYEEINNKDGIANCENNLGLIYNEMGNYEKAMRHLIKALKMREETQDKKGIAKCLLNIGNIYLNQENLNEALQYYEKSLTIAKSIDLWIEVANNHNNMGNIYKRQKKNKKAIDAFEEAAKIFEQIGNLRGVMITDLNIGDVYLDAQEYDKALGAYDKALPIAEKLSDQILIGLLHASKGSCLARMQRFGEAYDNLKKGLQILQNVGARNDITKVYEAFSTYYEMQGDYKEALRSYKNFKILKDSIFTENQAKQVAKMRTLYESEKKEQENQLLRKENALKDAENQRKNIYIIASLLVLALVGVLTFVLYRNNKEKQKTNQLLKQQAEELAAANEDILQKNAILEQQKEEILAQRDAIERQNKDLSFKNEQIRASIRAAQLIQNTILPYERRISGILKDSFVFYQPKDVVSGDLYWIDKEGEDSIVVAIDCTGHGVSGALMTMIAYSILDRIIHVYKITDPAAILEKMHEEVKHALAQDETGNRDGMDVAIVSIQNENIVFAGAKRPLFYYDIQKEQVLEIKGQRRAIGGFQDENIHFENHYLSLQTGSMLYVCSDGYTDQNDVNRKKFSEEKLKILLQKIAPMEAFKQKQIVSDLMQKYMENTEQRDDMMLIGVRV